MQKKSHSLLCHRTPTSTSFLFDAIFVIHFFILTSLTCYVFFFLFLLFVFWFMCFTKKRNGVFLFEFVLQSAPFVVSFPFSGKG